MHQAIPYRSWQSIDTKQTTLAMRPPWAGSVGGSASMPSEGGGRRRDVVASVSESAAIVFARRGCCMSHVVKRLLLGLGANPAVYEVDEEHESGVVKELEAFAKSSNVNLQLPAVFIGGTLFGGLDRVMATHISGDLVPILKQAGALWL
ncbi:glutaredoxin-C9-like [Cucumis melo var. makuwa]|uniref:Glutaredoxin-C9-like n=1 Tax=Cucumis melo var. makuwa TaxID=1194695 RepID=A0A5A7VGI4_CUCMM|nr:glutaredoxin-C9-like [Cucumis melo var. makuwa]